MPEPVRYPRMASFKSADALTAHLAASGIRLPFDAARPTPGTSALAAPLALGDRRLSNRFAILPMEGWDGHDDGTPSGLTTRRWQRFGVSGAALIWGGEAVAVRHDGRANPHQLMLTRDTARAIGQLPIALRAAHAAQHGQESAERVYLGLQLTHSGRFSRPEPHAGAAPLVAYSHPMLDARAAPVRVLSDDELDELCETFIDRARLARELGFDFVDIKHCHGYLAHELLSARTRDGRYGGSLENRMRFVRTIVQGIRAAVPGLGIGVRVSAFDLPPFSRDADGVGSPMVPDDQPYEFAFGRVRPANMEATLADARAFLAALRALEVRLICVTGGSPYYCPHVIRPALFPPSDGYLPPEDPLAGVARHIEATAALKASFPDLIFVGSGYTYLQEWLPNVAEQAVRDGRVDAVGIGRLVLSYPEFPADVLAGRPLRRQAICRTFSDCTSGPRNGLISGCFPLDPFYTTHPEHAALKKVKGT